MIVIIVGFLVIGCLLGMIAFFRISGLERRLTQLKNEVAVLQRPVAKAEQTQPQVVTQKPDIMPEPVAAKVELAPEPELAVAVPEEKKRDVEQALASRWFVWIGGAAVALGGLLLIKYAHDHSLISPVFRIILGLILAAALVACGEYVRRTRGSEVKDYVPAALSAAGLVIGFGSIYAAYALYQLLPAGVAFFGLGLIALGAFALSRLQGPLVAALGLIGAYAAPALINADHPNVFAFFPYIFVIVVASFFTLRGRNWWWLGYAAIAGAAAWTLLWIRGGAFSVEHSVPIGLFALALGGAATFLIEGRRIFAAEHGNLSAPEKISQPLWLAAVGMAAAAILLAALVFQTGHGLAALFMFAVGMALVLAFSWFKSGWSFAALVAAAFTLFVLMSWHDVSFQTWAMDESGLWTTVPGLITPPLFRNWMFAGLGGFAGIGAYGYWRRAEPQIWAGLAAGSALLFLFGAWARADFVMEQGAWAGLGVALAAALYVLAYLRRQTVSDDLSISTLIIGAALLTLFALDRLLDGVWYTMAVAALAVGVAWTTQLLPARHLGSLASVLATFATGRLFLAREFWREPANLPLGAHWPIYGYGVTAALLWWGSRFLKTDKYRQYGVALEGLSLGLVISLISLELRVLIGGGVVSDHMTLLELSAHILAWLGAAYGLVYRQQLYSSFVSLWGARILLAGSCLALIVMSLVALNPLTTGDRIEGGAIINTLWLAYLAPLVLLAFMARKLESLNLEKWRPAVGVLALVLLLAFVTLETKRLFQGPYLIAEFSSEAESYALSAAWLVTAVLLFIVGLSWSRQTIRYGGLAVMVLALLKTFAYDLWQLGGLWQIASVMGIGLSLIGVGWLYTKFVKEKAA